MFIKRLRIKNNRNKQDIRVINFKMGANFIVDTSSSEQHNKVGKTTLLKLIDIALGANGKKHIYFDSESNSTENTLETFINDYKVSVELEVVNSLDSEKQRCCYTLEVFLYNGGKRNINGKVLNQKQYREQLNKIFFNNNNEHPSFRQLIKSFVRISLTKDETSFLKNITRISNNEYRMIYNYLFNISSPEEDYKITDLSKKINTLKDDKKKYSKRNDIESISELEQVVKLNQEDEISLNAKLDNIVSKDFFKKNKDRINKVRQEYSKLISSIDEVDYDILNTQKYINRIEKNDHDYLNMDLAKSFFDEVKENIPDIDKTFNDLVNFNKKLRDNKVKFLNLELKKRQDQKIQLEETLNELLTNNESLISLVKDDKIDEYADVLEKLKNVQRIIASLNSRIEIYKKYDEDIVKAKAERELLESNIQNRDFKNISLVFNRYFSKYAKEISKEDVFLIYSEEKETFPIKVKSSQGTSTGTRKSIIASYDLAYQSFANEVNKQIPNFIVHDLMEHVESNNLSKIIEISEKVNTQYIVGILDENLDLAFNKMNISEGEKESMKILKLSSNDKLFKV